MAQTHNHGTLMPQETNFDNADQPGIAQPFSQAEIDDLLFGDDRPVEQRLERLYEIRNEMAARESGDWGGEDPAAMLGEIDRAIETLNSDEANADDTSDYANLSPALAQEADLESLSPDDVDVREAIEGPDEYRDDQPSVLDEAEWEDGDGFKPEQGVR